MGPPRTDLNIGQNSKSKIQKHLNFVRRSNLSRIALFPTTLNSQNLFLIC